MRQAEMAARLAAFLTPQESVCALGVTCMISMSTERPTNRTPSRSRLQSPESCTPQDINVWYHWTRFEACACSRQPARLQLRRIARGWSLPAADPSVSADLAYFGEVLNRTISDANGPTALLVDCASRLIVRSQSLSGQEHALFPRAQIFSLTRNPNHWMRTDSLFQLGDLAC